MSIASSQAFGGGFGNNQQKSVFSNASSGESQAGGFGAFGGSNIFQQPNNTPLKTSVFGSSSSPHQFGQGWGNSNR
jgi:hypothetical protein